VELDQQAHKVFRVLQVFKVQQVELDQQALKVRLELKVQQVHKAFKA